MAQGVTIPEHLKKKPLEKPDQNKRKGWKTPYGFIDFTVPVSYERACSIMKDQQERFAKMFDAGPDNESKWLK
jgi:hypothetical protein